jgi:hypothetical protein
MFIEIVYKPGVGKIFPSDWKIHAKKNSTRRTGMLKIFNNTILCLCLFVMHSVEKISWSIKLIEIEILFGMQVLSPSYVFILY